MQIHWNDRLERGITTDGGQYKCYATVDCSDFAINEPTSFDPKFYSYKINYAALGYEVSLSLTDRIVWISDPRLPGRKNDLQILRDSLKQKLMETELIVADATYSDLKYIYNSGLPNGVGRILRSRQESIFKRFKDFKVCRGTFRHGA